MEHYNVTGRLAQPDEKQVMKKLDWSMKTHHKKLRLLRELNQTVYCELRK
eukprot:NODE_14133_length_235_cov_1.577778.p1 GENE.NODE_14133_length_235_cov_1.577778~~NODE_14133_length_235_cov_1.577778.p1  ORF type:complete len:50 (+),score=15.24 NODE_14133_length_235_cov_1.577778:52-201(+)